MAAFLPTCTKEEISLIFGPVKDYLMEDENPDLRLRFSNEGVIKFCSESSPE